MKQRQKDSRVFQSNISGQRFSLPYFLICCLSVKATRKFKSIKNFSWFIRFIVLGSLVYKDSSFSV